MNWKFILAVVAMLISGAITYAVVAYSPINSVVSWDARAVRTLALVVGLCIARITYLYLTRNDKPAV